MFIPSIVELKLAFDHARFRMLRKYIRPLLQQLYHDPFLVLPAHLPPAGPRRIKSRNARRKKALIKQHGKVCHYCGRHTDQITLDHKQPRCSFPPDQGHLVDHFDNLVLACAGCNARKNDKTYEEFLAMSSNTP